MSTGVYLTRSLSHQYGDRPHRVYPMSMAESIPGTFLLSVAVCLIPSLSHENCGVPSSGARARTSSGDCHTSAAAYRIESFL